MIQQIIATIITFMLCYVMQSNLEVIGNSLGFGGVLAWAVPTFLIIVSIWKLVARDWNLGDAVAVIVLSIVVMLYYTQDVGRIILEVSKLMLGLGVGVIIGYLIKGDD
ncbi:hypothetical protein [Methanothermococcus thermolithotrophicus]|uniref:hypothetical protein n=1 Tax=Methanothermococcus thermolithotrophicus TaxID=2186 RepID=UPI00036151EB|nr:hypothetical protein [Methanothermococcus thermolithotrophicus]